MSRWAGKFYPAGGGTARRSTTPPSTLRAWPLPESLDHIQAVLVGGKI
jgi:hypothetical protein